MAGGEQNRESGREELDGRVSRRSECVEWRENIYSFDGEWRVGRGERGDGVWWGLSY